MNDTLRRALLRAQLSEDDVAARLAVDPKTVRRWAEGRVPYLRHRWELARLLGCDETDLWPGMSVARSRPEEVWAVYPHRNAVPSDVWRNLFGSAEREIGILANSGQFVVGQPGVLAALGNAVQAGARVRICLREPADSGNSAIDSGVLAPYELLHERGDVEFRVHQAALSNSIYQADDELLIGQYAYGVPSSQSPVLHLRRVGAGEMVTTYIESFEQVWTDARSLG